MGEPFIGEIRAVSFNFAPRGWALCDGQTLPINQNQALFSLLGTFYGGNGTQTFQLPNLQGRVPIHQGTGFTIGQAGGESIHTLTVGELPSHTHTVSAITSPATLSSPSGARLAAAGTSNYAPVGGTPVTLDPGAFLAAGGSQPHENTPPYLVVSYVIALQGIFPSRT